MSQIENIQWKADGTVLLTLSGGEALALFASALLEFGLQVGQVLSNDLYCQIQRAAQSCTIYQKAIALLSRREHSVWELRQKLRQRFPEDAELIQETLQLLEEKDLLSDERFTRAFVRSRVSARHWGPFRLRAELKQRGITDEILESILQAETDSDLWRSQAEAVISRAGDLSDPAAVRRLARKLYQRGFPHDLIRQLLPSPY